MPLWKGQMGVWQVLPPIWEVFILKKLSGGEWEVFRIFFPDRNSLVVFFVALSMFFLASCAVVFENMYHSTIAETRILQSPRVLRARPQHHSIEPKGLLSMELLLGGPLSLRLKAAEQARGQRGIANPCTPKEPIFLKQRSATHLFFTFVPTARTHFRVVNPSGLLVRQDQSNRSVGFQCSHLRSLKAVTQICIRSGLICICRGGGLRKHSVSCR